MAKRLLGKEVNEALVAALQTRTAALREKGITPTLGIVRLGENPSDLSYEKGATKRAEEVGLTTIVCADSEEEAAKIATLNPDIIVAEPSALIGTGVSVGPEYVEAATRCVKDVNPDILVLTAAGIAGGEDVYNTIIAGADATGSSSGVAKAADRSAMVDEMIAACRKAWDERHA